MSETGCVVVVGGAAGIGAAIARALGDRAVVWSRRHGVDAADPDQVQEAARDLIDRRGVPWAVVHAVGDFHEAPLLGTDAATASHLFCNNVTTALHVVQSFVPRMADAGRGRVLLFGAAGVDRDRAMTRAPVYFAAKAALLQLARSLAAEVAPRNVTVNMISPGLIHHPDSHQESQRRMLPRVPMGRLGSVDDVTGLALWLLSGEAGYVTGQNFTVDGGLQG